MELSLLCDVNITLSIYDKETSSSICYQSHPEADKILGNHRESSKIINYTNDNFKELFGHEKSMTCKLPPRKRKPEESSPTENSKQPAELTSLSDSSSSLKDKLMKKVNGLTISVPDSPDSQSIEAMLQLSELPLSDDISLGNDIEYTPLEDISSPRGLKHPLPASKEEPELQCLSAGLRLFEPYPIAIDADKKS